MMVSFVLSFFPRDVLDEILNLIESVSEDFPSYSLITLFIQYRFQFLSPICRLTIIQFTIIRRFVIAPDQFLQNDHSIPINALSHCDMLLVPAVLTDKGSKDENQYIDHSNYNWFPLSKPIKGLRQGIRTSFVPPLILIHQFWLKRYSVSYKLHTYTVMS